MTLKEIREDLQEIRYYFTHKAAFDNAIKVIGVNSVMDKVERYNKIFQNAPARMYDLYLGLYVNGNTQEAYAEEAGYSAQHVRALNKQLVLYLQKVMN
ncbi:MAG: hypothetical protein K2J83_00640 [Clostridia bacterium]|nr:hypothetical protein [Clostridia bacterium]